MATKATATRPRIETINEIVNNHSAAKIDGVEVDTTSANAYKTVYDGLKPAFREVLEGWPFAYAMEKVWQLHKKCKA